MAAAVAFGARVALALVLAVAAVAKLRHRARVVENFAAVLTPAAAAPVATVVPALEFLCAVGLVGARSSPVPGAAAAVLLAGFTVVVARAIARRVPCACFGASSAHAVGTGAIVRNAGLIALAILATGDATGAP
ncbi:MAG: MauE/DoxX family redox-associated membrane protein [Actinomycetota bacterium]